MIGESKLQANDFSGALREFQKALEINPQLPSLNSYYGTALANTGDTRGAEAAFRKELASDANDYVANFQLGKLLQQDGDKAESRRSFERALSQRPMTLVSAISWLCSISKRVRRSGRGRRWRNLSAQIRET